MTTSGSDDTNAVPDACTLDQEDGAARMRRWQALAAKAPPTATREGWTLTVHFSQGPDVYPELVALAGAEQECCSFATWSVTEQGGHPVLHVRAHSHIPDDIASIAALFGVA